MDRGKYLIMYRGKPFRAKDEGEVVALLSLLRKEFHDVSTQGLSADIEIYALVNGSWHDCKAKFM
jgi:hypothetical protein